MSLEQAMADVAQTAADVTKTGLKLAETAVKKAWSIMDAASQKQAPSEYLSQQAVNAVQGKDS
jgi:hypothetical protein